MKKFACYCCGYLVYDKPNGETFEICPICWWQDDAYQHSRPDSAGGANKVSLNEAKNNFKLYGACEPRFTGRKPYIDEIPDIK